MMIILLGEVVVAVGGSAVEVPVHDPRYWLGLLAGLVLAAALWWIYFTAAAPISEYVLRASGGNPTLAYGLYAGGHLSPAFALLTMAAGMSLALSGQAPTAAAWFITAGLAVYLTGSRAMAGDQRVRFGPPLRAAVVVVTACLAFLQPLISVTGVVACRRRVGGRHRRLRDLAAPGPPQGHRRRPAQLLPPSPEPTPTPQ